jgi:hypothetical protein
LTIRSRCAAGRAPRSEYVEPRAARGHQCQRRQQQLSCKSSGMSALKAKPVRRKLSHLLSTRSLSKPKKPMASSGPSSKLKVIAVSAVCTIVPPHGAPIHGHQAKSGSVVANHAKVAFGKGAPDACHRSCSTAKQPKVVIGRVHRKLSHRQLNTRSAAAAPKIEPLTVTRTSGG